MDQFEHLSPENEKNHEGNDRGHLVSKFGFERAASKEQHEGQVFGLLQSNW